MTDSFTFAIMFETISEDEKPYFQEADEFVKSAFESCLDINRENIEFKSYGIGTPDDEGKRCVFYYYTIPEISPKEAKKMKRYCLNSRYLLPMDPRTMGFTTLPPGGLNRHPEYGYCEENKNE